MGAQGGGTTGPDLTQGIRVDEVPDGGIVLGHVGDDGVIVARRGGEIFAVGASCTHYGGPLAEGLVVGDEVRCPWHHACFSLRTGEALRAPALAPITCYAVERDGPLLRVRGKEEPITKTLSAAVKPPASVVIVGAGAAGSACAEMLRREGYAGPITMLGRDGELPVDRPNLSKDYLAGNAPEEWIPIRPRDFWEELSVTLRLEAPAVKLDPASSTLELADGSRLAYGALLLATGADPIHLAIPGSDRIRYLRTFADSRAIIEAAGSAKRAVVLGASFIGLEVAASLRTRGLEVHVVAPEARPLERVLGPELGDFVRALHEEKGVTFHLGRTASAVGATDVTLDDGATLPADLVVAGVGVRPSLALAEEAGLAVDRGIVVDEQLRTSAAGVWAAGDVARYPDRRSGERLRIEHWVVAQRMGQAAARSMLGLAGPYEDVPFFWSAHYDVVICVVGHAPRWDSIEIDGSLAARDAKISYMAGGKPLAVATVFRDRESLAAEAAFERS